MVACRSPKPKMGVRLTPCLFGNVCESMGQRLNLQICEDTGRKRALPRKTLGCRQAVRHSTLTAVSRQFESDQPSFFNVFLINFIFAVLVQNGIAAVLKTVARKDMGVRIPQTAFKFAQLIEGRSFRPQSGNERKRVIKGQSTRLRTVVYRRAGKPRPTLVVRRY